MQEKRWTAPLVKQAVVTQLSAFLSLAETFFISPHMPAFVFGVNPKLNPPQTLTIEKCLLNKTASSRSSAGHRTILRNPNIPEGFCSMLCAGF